MTDVVLEKQSETTTLVSRAVNSWKFKGSLTFNALHFGVSLITRETITHRSVEYNSAYRIHATFAARVLTPSFSTDLFKRTVRVRETLGGRSEVGGRCRS